MNDKMLNKIKSSGSELDLSDLFWHILSKWRVLLVCGLILGLLLGCAGAFKSLSDLSDPNYVSGAKEKNAYQQRLYDITMTQYESRIERLSADILQQEEYAAHAALLTLDPYQVYVCEGLYYVEVRLDAAEGQMQGPDYTTAVISAYGAKIGSLDAGAILTEAGALLPEPELDNYEGFLSVTENSAGGTLSYKAYGATAEQAQALSEAVNAAIRESCPAIRESICEHSITAVSESLALRSDADLLQMHVDYDANLANLASSMNSVINKRDGTSAPKLISLSRMAVVKSAAKKAAVGFAAGVVLGAVCFAVSFITKSLVADPDDVMNRYGVSILGVIPSGKRRKGIDAHIARHFGFPLGMTEEEGLRFACANLAEAGRDRKYLLMSGSGEKAAVDKLCGKLKEQMPELQLRSVGSILRDPEARMAFNESDAVIFVETLQQARHGELRRELIQTLEAEKQCLGFLLVEKGVV